MTASRWVTFLRWTEQSWAEAAAGVAATQRQMGNMSRFVIPELRGD